MTIDPTIGIMKCRWEHRDVEGMSHCWECSKDGVVQWPDPISEGELKIRIGKCPCGWISRCLVLHEQTDEVAKAYTDYAVEHGVGWICK